MKFTVEKKGEKFLVVNGTTKSVRGVHKTPGDAKQHAKELQVQHDKGVQMASARLTPPKDMESDDSLDDEGE